MTLRLRVILEIEGSVRQRYSIYTLLLIQQIKKKKKKNHQGQQHPKVGCSFGQELPLITSDPTLPFSRLLIGVALE